MTTRPIKFRAWEKSLNLMWENVQDAYDTLGEHGNKDQVLTPCSFGDILGQEDFVVMQFTGLLDKNGKEIYEGDIVQICFEEDYDRMEDKLSEIVDHGWEKVVVEYSEAHAGYAFDGEALFGHEYTYPIVTEGYITEIIGNIWQNPELLK